MSDTDRFREAARTVLGRHAVNYMGRYYRAPDVDRLVDDVTAAIRTEAEALAAERVKARDEDWSEALRALHVAGPLTEPQLAAAALGFSLTAAEQRGREAERREVRLSQADRELISMYGSASAREAGPGADLPALLAAERRRGAEEALRAARKVRCKWCRRGIEATCPPEHDVWTHVVSTAGDREVCRASPIPGINIDALLAPAAEGGES